VTQVYKQFSDFEYMALALSISLPFLFVPLLFPSPAEKNTPITERYFLKATTHHPPRPLPSSSAQSEREEVI
jgi:hypothetical protein